VPVNIMIGLLALLVALIAYSIGTWGAFRAKAVGPRQLVAFWIGFAFDVVATWMMAIQIGRIGNDLHTYLALAGMAGMLIVAALGTWGYLRSNASLQTTLSRLVLAPWVLWVFVFVWGMIERGSARMR
jgi:hypothetical protein